jgi:hypothetical protein
MGLVILRSAVLALAAALALAANAQTKFGEHLLPPGADPGLFKPLPERKDVVSWRMLAQVELVRVKDRFLPQFSSGVSALDKKDVKLQGFMMPLEMGEKQSHFILSAMPQSCMFCMPGGPEQLVEVRSKTPVKYTFDPVVLSGRLAVLKDDPSGVYYRLTEAIPVK